jgi:FkbM family methyltransferase
MSSDVIKDILIPHAKKQISQQLNIISAVAIRKSIMNNSIDTLDAIDASDDRPSHGRPRYDLTRIILSQFPPSYAGIMVEVGAAFPEAISISYPLRSMGWTIISVEPNPEFCLEFRNRGLPVLEYAATSTDEGRRSFLVSPGAPSASSLELKDHFYNDHNKMFGWVQSDYRTISVEALKLDTILARHHPEILHVDALVIDVEGWEMEVLYGFDMQRFAPKIVCLENWQSSKDYRDYMSSLGYQTINKIHQDEFFLKT